VLSTHYMDLTRTLTLAPSRCVVLSTHYMDEADALAQRIGIMAAGRLRVLGSPQHLKSRHGGGYRVELKAANAQSDAGLTALVHSHFAHVKRVASHQGQA
jgi:ABC-type multidrug transport system ATPase subunit